MIRIDEKKCTGCKVCTRVCPQDVIKMIEKKAVIKKYKNCMECGACSLNCQFDAIELTKGTGCLIAIIKEDILKITKKGTGCCGNNGENASICC